LADLDIVTAFLPMVDRADGRLEADLTLSGSAARPYFSGHISLADGLVAHDASGLRLSEIQLSGEVTGDEKARLNGSFRALDGTGRLQAIVDLSDILSPRVELSLVGENLTLLDAPDLKVVVEPDIQLEWQDGVFDINGSLLIPSARIAPSVLPESTVLTSPDLVIVAGELPGSEAEAETKSDIAIRGNFEVTLGEEVELDLFVAVAKVNGSVNFTWQDELLPIANGHYSLAGQIQAFGQVLRITEGNIGFPGVPADNPHLNIRAERRIYGNSEIRRAGVFVTGTLNRPIVEPYTDPMTNRERAQTLLITGSDFNMETGVGAVDIGTYIAPRVFVSYGIGVFEDENVISIRYDLGRNWGIKATSGQRQTGLDISYTIER
jgi:translocation and assembly module TamB